MDESRNILGCYASITIGKWEDEQTARGLAATQGELFREYIWGDKGISYVLKRLKSEDYGNDCEFILFQFYVNPLPVTRQHLKDIGRFRKKEKSIGIPVVIDNDNFFSKTEEGRWGFLKTTLIDRLGLVSIVLKRNGLDTNMTSLIAELQKILGMTEVPPGDIASPANVILGQLPADHLVTDKVLRDFRGPVKKVRTKSYRQGKTEKDGDSALQSEDLATYDERGNLIEEIRSVVDGSRCKSLFRRDRNGKRTEKIITLPSHEDPGVPPSPPPPVGHADVLVYSTFYRRDSEKRSLEATTYRQGGELFSINTYLFDEQGRVAEHHYQDGRKMAFRSEFRKVIKRDADGVAIESAFYSGDGTIKGRHQFQSVVDEKGNWVWRSETVADPEGKTGTAEFVTVRVITYY